MIGHEELIALRKAGRVPAAVMVEIDPPYPLEEHHLGVWLTAESSERFERLDLRAVVGLPVFVVGDVAADVVRFCDAVMAAHAKAAIGRVGLHSVVYAKGETPWLNS